MPSVLSESGLLGAADGSSDVTEGASVRLPVLCILGASATVAANISAPAPPPSEEQAASVLLAAAGAASGSGPLPSPATGGAAAATAGSSGGMAAAEHEPFLRRLSGRFNSEVLGEGIGMAPAITAKRPTAPAGAAPGAGAPPGASGGGNGGAALSLSSLDVEVSVDSVSLWVSQRRLRLLQAVGQLREGSENADGSAEDTSRGSSQRAANDVPLSARFDSASYGAAASLQGADGGGAHQPQSRVRSIAVPAVAASASVRVGCIAALLMDDEGVTSPVLEACILDLTASASSNAPAAAPHSAAAGGAGLAGGGTSGGAGGSTAGLAGSSAAASSAAAGGGGATIWDRLGMADWAEDRLGGPLRADAVRVRVSARLQVDYHNDEKARGRNRHFEFKTPSRSAHLDATAVPSAANVVAR